MRVPRAGARRGASSALMRSTSSQSRARIASQKSSSARSEKASGSDQDFEAATRASSPAARVLPDFHEASAAYQRAASASAVETPAEPAEAAARPKSDDAS